MQSRAYPYVSGRPSWAHLWRAVFVLALASSGTRALCAETLQIGGEGATFGAIAQLRDAYLRAHPDAKITLFPTVGTGSAVNALLSGALDVSITTAALTGDERARVAAWEIARVPFVFVVAVTSPLDEVALSHLLEIYQGRTSTWPDGSRIRLILRPSSVPDTIFLKRISPEWKKALEDLEVKRGMVVVATAQEAADRVEKTPGALATLTASLIVTEKRAIKALRIDGVAPSGKTVADGTYRFYHPVIIATLPAPTSAAETFAAFVRSPAGREVLVRSGHAVPQLTQ